MLGGVTSRQHLQSAIRQLLVVPRHRLSSCGRRALCVAGPLSGIPCQTACRIRLLAGTVLDNHRSINSEKLWSFGSRHTQHTQRIQRIRGFTTMRYINRLFTYFYLLTIPRAQSLIISYFHRSNHRGLGGLDPPDFVLGGPGESNCWYECSV